MISNSTRSLLDELIWEFGECENKVDENGEVDCSEKFSIYDKIMIAIDNLVDLPFEVGDTVYVVDSCSNLEKYQDTDTGAIIYAFKNDCPFVEGVYPCSVTDNKRDYDGKETVVKSTVNYIYNKGHGWVLGIEGFWSEFELKDFGTKIFTNLADANNYIRNKENKG